MGLFTYIRDKVKDQDIYVETVNLTFKGEGEFKSTYGGIVTLWIKAVTSLYVLFLFSELVTYNRSNNTTTQLVEDLTHSPSIHYPGQNGFAFAFNMMGPNPERLLDPTYFTLELVGISVTHCSFYSWPSCSFLEQILDIDSNWALCKHK